MKAYAPHFLAVMALCMLLVSCGELETGSSLRDNRSPVARFSVEPESGSAPLTVTLDGSASSDSDGSITTYRWTSSAGHSGTGAQVSMTFDTVGTHQLTLVVEDNVGATDSLTQEVSVSGANTDNVPPNADFVATPPPQEGGPAPRTINVDASTSSDSDGSITSYLWTTSTGLNASGVQASLTFTEEGLHDITLTVTDNGGATDSYTLQFRVYAPTSPPPDDDPPPDDEPPPGDEPPPDDEPPPEDEPPEVPPPNGEEPIADFEMSPDFSLQAVDVHLDASDSTDPDGGGIAEYRWSSSAGDSFSRTTPTATMTFALSDIFDVTITLTVVDDEGDTASTSRGLGFRSQ